MIKSKLRDKALEAFKKTGLSHRSFPMFRKGYEARYSQETITVDLSTKEIDSQVIFAKGKSKTIKIR